MILKIKQGDEFFGKTYITSDTHFSHVNICRGTSSWGDKGEFRLRDFDTTSDMNEAMIKSINDVVPQDGLLIHLGDFSFFNIDQIAKNRNRLNVQHIILIYGNHDEKIIANKRDSNGIQVQDYFCDTDHYLELEYAGSTTSPKGLIMATHFPMMSWDKMNRDSIHLHGHVHLSADKKIGYNNIQKGRMMDVGVDGNNLKPYKIEDVIKVLDKRENKTLCKSDHHTN